MSAQWKQPWDSCTELDVNAWNKISACDACRTWKISTLKTVRKTESNLIIFRKRNRSGVWCQFVLAATTFIHVWVCKWKVIYSGRNNINLRFNASRFHSLWLSDVENEAHTKPSFIPSAAVEIVHDRLKDVNHDQREKKGKTNDGLICQGYLQYAFTKTLWLYLWWMTFRITDIHGSSTIYDYQTLDLWLLILCILSVSSSWTVRQDVTTAKQYVMNIIMTGSH